MYKTASKITRVVLDAQVNCRLKAAYLRLCGEEGIKSDFETLLLDARQEVRANAIEKIRGHYADGEVEMDIPLSRTALGRGVPFILHGHIQDDRQAIRFDGLKKVDGASIFGEFHYEPVMFSEFAACFKGRASDARNVCDYSLAYSRQSSQ